MATGRIGVTPNLRTRWSKAPAGGTTSLSGLDDNSVSLVYDAGFEAVYRNGVLLSRGNDYTATNGTTITLIDATIAGDIIEVFANQAIPLTSTYTQAVADAKFINNSLVDAKGDIIAATAADTPARLAVGSNDQVLTADSSTSTGLKWATPSAGGMTLIQETVANAISSLSFSSIAGTYKQLFLVWSGIYHSAANNGFSVRLNNSSSSIYYEQGAAVYGSNATSQYVQGTGIGISLGIQSGSYLLGYDTSDYPSNLQLQCQGSLLIDNYASTTKYKYYKADFSYFDGGIGALATDIYGVFASTSAITSVDIFRGTGSGTFSNYTDTSIRLYGVS